MTNYYNTVEVCGSGENGFSFTQALDSFGTKLIEPRQAAYGGYHFFIYPKERAMFTPNIKSATNLNIFDKIKIAVGYVLKRIAAFFNKEIEAKYRLASLNEDFGTKDLFEILTPTKTVTISKQGSETEKMVNDCLLCCFSCCGICCEATAETNHYHSRRRC